MSDNGVILGIIIGVIAGSLIMSWLDTNLWEHSMVNKGFAEYNQTNGNWQWKGSGK